MHCTSAGRSRATPIEPVYGTDAEAAGVIAARKAQLDAAGVRYSEVVSDKVTGFRVNYDGVVFSMLHVLDEPRELPGRVAEAASTPASSRDAQG